MTETTNNQVLSLRAIVSQLDDKAVLLDQLDGAKIQGSATELTVTVRPESATATYSDGPLPVRAIVEDSAGNATGELLIWMENGRIASVEHAWYTDEAPRAWPGPDQLKFI